MQKKHVTSESSTGRKFYVNDDTHKASRPAQMWFQSAQEGMVLFIVFYSKACRWSKCRGCNLPSKMSSRHVGYKELIAQINYVFSDARVIAARNSIRKVIISNNGSVLDRETFSPTALMFLLVQLNLNFPYLSVLSIESRPEYVERAMLELIGKVLTEGETRTALEIAVGFEVFDDSIRNDVLCKGLTLEAFEQLAKKVTSCDHRLKCYLMQKPTPTMTDAEAIADIEQAIDYLDQLACRYKLDINIHLNPTYAAAGTILGEAFKQGEYTPPRLLDVATAVRHAKGKRLSVFIGLNDEGLSVQNGSFIQAGDELIVAALEQFNITQDYDILDDLCTQRSTADLLF